jgi:hypothetical protein
LAFKHPGHDFNLIRFLARGSQIGLARFAAVQLFLNFGFRNFNTRGNAVDDYADRSAV